MRAFSMRSYNRVRGSHRDDMVRISSERGAIYRDRRMVCHPLLNPSPWFQLRIARHHKIPRRPKSNRSVSRGESKPNADVWRHSVETKGASKEWKNRWKRKTVKEVGGGEEINARNNIFFIFRPRTDDDSSVQITHLCC